MADHSPIKQAACKLRQALEVLEPRINSSAGSSNWYPQVASAINDCLAEVSALALWGPENRLPSSELWNIAGHLLCRGWLQNQARTKPRGYAGDYEMLARIHQNRLCDDPLGRLLDRYFQSQAAPQAVRNRMAMMADWIVEAAGNEHSPCTTHPALRVAVVGSAFALEICAALPRLKESVRSRIHVILLDVDPAAIDFARTHLEPLLRSDQLMAASTNLFRLPDRPPARVPLANAQLIFCPGLFDYLDDDAATAMLRCLFEPLAPGGRLIVFQFAPHNPTRAYMEWFGNWYLTYRDGEAFRNLVNSAVPSAAKVVFGAEELGIDLFAAIERPSFT